MGLFILKRLGVMILTALCLTFVVFWLTNLDPNLEKLAKTQGNSRMSDEAVVTYLENRGYSQALPIKYGEWIGLLPGYVITGTDGETRHAVRPEAHRLKMPPSSAAYCKANGASPPALKKTSARSSRSALDILPNSWAL